MRYRHSNSITLARDALLPILPAEGLLELGSKWLPFASPLSGDLVILSVSSMEYDIPLMKNKTEEMTSERKDKHDVIQSSEAFP